LLIEEGRENSISFSEAFNDSSWGKASAGISAPTVTANQGAAPDGQNTADRIVFAASTAAGQEGHVWKVASGGTRASGSSVTASVWLRTETGTATVYLSITEGATGGTFTACSVTTTWTRFSVTRTLSTTAFVFMEIGPDTRASGANQPLSSGATALVWGAQLEAGSFATSYIPTTTSSLTRSADVCSITGADFNRFYNSTSGTLLSEASISNLIGNNRGIVQIDNGTNVSILRHVYSFGDGGFRSIIRAGGDTPTVLSTILGTASTIQKRIIAYEGTSFASVTNGGVVATATRTMPTGLNAMRIGNLTDGSFYLSGHIAAIRFYKKRLPNAKIQALTA
jgi:hypothetical protein